MRHGDTRRRLHSEMSQSQFWCLTLNNFSQDEFDKLISLDGNEMVRYYVFGREVGSSGTPHIQGYIEFKCKRTINQVKQVTSMRAHLEVRKSKDGLAAANYCKKDGMYDEFGEIGTGKRTSKKEKIPLSELIVKAQNEGLTALAEDEQISNSDFKGFLFRSTYLLKPTTQFEKPIVHWFFGSTGTGKTRKVMYEIGEQPFFNKMSGPWFDGYCGENIILIDDLREGGIDFDVLLRLTGGYGNRFPVKGGSVVVNAKIIYITAPFNPAGMFTLSYKDSIEQLNRRITNLVEFVHEWFPPQEEETFVSLGQMSPLRNLYPVTRALSPPSILRCKRRTLPSPTQMWDGLVSSESED